MTSELRRVMSGRSDEELERIATEDAPDYTDEAIAAAKGELERRGKDVSVLVARIGEPRGAPKESHEKVTRLAFQALAAFVVLGAASALVPPLRVLASVAFWIAVLLFLWSIGR